MTMSNSIKVKPSGCLAPVKPSQPLVDLKHWAFEVLATRRAGKCENLRFIEFHCLMEQAGDTGSFEKMLQRTDAEGKWDAREKHLSVVSDQWSVEVLVPTSRFFLKDSGDSKASINLLRPRPKEFEPRKRQN
jgi:hypothetical protein